MGRWYGNLGSVKVRKTKGFRKYLRNYDQFAIDELEVKVTSTDDPKVVVLEFSGGADVSHGHAGDLESAVQVFGRWAVATSFITITDDDQTYQLYVGPPGMERQGRSALELDIIKAQTTLLTPDDVLRLIEHLSGMVGSKSDCQQASA